MGAEREGLGTLTSVFYSSEMSSQRIYRGMKVEAARQCAKDRKKTATTENQGSGVKYMGYGVYIDDCVCVLSDLT